MDKSDNATSGIVGVGEIGEVAPISIVQGAVKWAENQGFE